MSDDAPLKILKVLTDETGQQDFDQRQRGSTLYTVVLLLNRAASSREASIFKETWDRPPRYTTMHRAGIADMSGNRLYLRGTTLEELRDVHMETLTHVMPVVAARAAEVEAEIERRRVQAEAEQAAHREHIADVASQIKFD